MTSSPSVSVGTRRSHALGLAAIFAAWAGAAISVPYSKVLLNNGFTTQDILIIRSVLCAILALIISGGVAWRSSPRIIAAGLIVAVSSICFYEALRVWDVVPVAVLLSCQPVFNLIIVFAEGRRPSVIVIASLVCLVGGTFLFLNDGHMRLSWTGLAWILAAALIGAIGADQWSRGPRSSTVSEKCFWLSFPLIFISIGMNMKSGHSFEPMRLAAPGLFVPAFLYTAFVTVYIFCSIVPYSPVGEMNVVKAAVLMQLATPFVIKLSTKVNGGSVSASQWAGAAIIIASAMLIARDAIRARPKAVLVSQPSIPSG